MNRLRTGLWLVFGLCLLVLSLYVFNVSLRPWSAPPSARLQPRPQPAELEQSHVDYGVWQLALPYFSDAKQAQRLLHCAKKDSFMNRTLEQSRAILLACSSNVFTDCQYKWEDLSPHLLDDKFLNLDLPRFRIGSLISAHNAVLAKYDLCPRWTISRLPEYKGMFLNADDPPSEELVIYLNAEEGSAFQHFLDTLLPKLVYAMQFLTPQERRVAKLMVPKMSELTLEILEQLGFSTNQVIYRSANLSAKKWINPCMEPLRHPKIWRAMQDMLLYGATSNDPSEGAASGKKRDLIVYISRATNKRGRKVTNEPEVIQAINKLIEKRGHHEKLIMFDHSKVQPPGLQGFLRLFGRAKAIIGPHGGGLYNMWFTPPGALVLEFFPLAARCAYPALGSFWYHAAMFGHRYGMLFPETEKSSQDMSINARAVVQMLERHLDPINTNIPAKNTPVDGLR